MKTFYQDTEGTIWIMGRDGIHQVIVGPDKDGGPLAISSYAQTTGEEKTFFSVTEAVKYMRNAGARPRDISKLRPALYRAFKPFSSKFRRGKAGPFEGAGGTSVDRVSREPMK